MTDDPAAVGGPAAAVDGPQAVHGDQTAVGLRIEGLRKWYGDTRALDGLDIVARPGEILGVAGPNGAGKSTLIKILAGETREDEGSIRLDGVAWDPYVDLDRVAVVHQEAQLFPNLTVAENLMVGREGTRALRRRLDEQERRLLDDLSILDVADRPLESVPLAVRQRTEIARALARSARVFLFDEPNSALTEEESTDLFRRMHDLAGAGHVVILVSHRLAELVEHTTRVAIILDGTCTTVLEGEALTQDAIAAELVVGQAAREPREQITVHLGEPAADDAAVLTLREWSHARGHFQGIDLHVRAGEIVALMGVEGSGARELVRSVAGFERTSGHIEIQGRIEAPATTATGDSSFVSADRQASLFSNLTVGDNMVARLDDEIAPRGALRPGRMRRIANELRDRFRVKAASIAVPIRSLSGGNQQKVAIAAAIVKRPEVLVLEEPTRGVDIGSKSEIYRLMRQYAAEGHAVLIYCTEVPEAFEAADLVYVVSDGRLSPPVLVMTHPDVESLARAITRLERHTRTQPAA
ncbi:MAG: sugar ABC transporter ATP-binding protein [Chloroflexi bacterium]|nr:sugar ABC transporter ATP-binding protein [Chloroflexota bacterium]